MNARLPLLRAIPSGADALPPYQPGTQRFAVTVEGVALDTLIHYGDDFDLSVAAICAAIKAEDDHCVTQGDYMLDSEDCIKVVRGEWVRPVYEIGSAAQKGQA